MTDPIEPTSPTRQFAPLAILLGIPLVFAAIFFYTSPVVLETGGEQGIFKCGSPSSPNSDAKNVCAQPEKVERNKAIYSGLSGVALLGLGGFWMLRGHRDEDDEWEDEDRPRRRRDDDIDVRDERRGRDRNEVSERGLRGVSRGRSRRSRAAEDVDEDRSDAGPEADVERTRSSRRGDRRSVREDDFDDPEPRRRTDDEPAPRRRTDDDWSSDGWR